MDDDLEVLRKVDEGSVCRDKSDESVELINEKMAGVLRGLINDSVSKGRMTEARSFIKRMSRLPNTDKEVQSFTKLIINKSRAGGASN